MFKNGKIFLFAFLISIPVLWLAMPYRANAFPVRIDEDCFYGEGLPTGGGLGTWMGYAVEFTPPYSPYTVDSVSLYIEDMRLMPDVDPTLVISIIDQNGILGQKSHVTWRSLEGHEGWVMVDLADHEYNGNFTIIVHSGIDSPRSSYVRENPEAIFRLGIDSSDTSERSFWFTSNDPPERFPDPERLGENGMSIISKLVPVSRNNPLTPEFPGGNWMIRAQSPGLVTESTYIYITMEDIERLHRTPEIPLPDWHLPPIEGMGPHATVHCPTSLAGVTFYYYEDDRSKKFLTPHDGPWANPDLIQTLGAMCEELYREGIVGIEHIGIYNDRNIYGTNARSSHAYGLGIDLSGFQYSDGRVYMVEDHNDPDVRAVLEYIRETYLKKYFPTVLDWHYQRHNNHFHVNLPYPH